MPLTDFAARKATPREKAYKLSDEKGRPQPGHGGGPAILGHSPGRRLGYGFQPAPP